MRVSIALQLLLLGTLTPLWLYYAEAFVPKRAMRLGISGLGSRLEKQSYFATSLADESRQPDPQKTAPRKYNGPRNPRQSARRQYDSGARSASGSSGSGGNSVEDDLISQLNRSLQKDLGSFSVALKNIAATFETSTGGGGGPRQRRTGSMSSGEHQLTFADRVTIILETDDVADRLSSDEATNILWSLGRLDFRFHVPAHRAISLRLLKRLCNTDAGGKCTSRQVTTALGGLARMGMRWGYLDDGQKTDIISLIGAVCSLLNDREISNLMHSLNKIQISWSILPKSIQDGLLDSFLANVKMLSDQQGAMTIYSMGQLGVEIAAVTPAVRDNIYIVVHQVLDDVLKLTKSQLRAREGRFAVQQMSNAIYGLAKQGADYYSIPTSLRDKIKLSLLHGMAFMNDQEVANTIYSHGVMGAVWMDLPPELHDCLRSAAIRCLGSMIAQGVSNTIYGMSLMGAQWGDMGLDYQYCVLEAVIKTLGGGLGGGEEKGGSGSKDDSSKNGPATASSTQQQQQQQQQQQPRQRHYGGTSPQAVANIVYSLGISGAEWGGFPSQVQKAIFRGLTDYGEGLTSQEISNVVYGLGLLRAEYHGLPSRIGETLTVNLDRVATQRAATGTTTGGGGGGGGGGTITGLNQQEVCATLHGFAKMDAQWGDMTEALKFTLLSCISNLHDMGALCLACTVYSLGILNATWESLPTGIRAILLESAHSSTLQDQTMANVVYGLSSMEARWDKLEPGWTQLILENLNRPDSFSEDVPQHIANTLWGLAKMDATWSDLPRELMMDAFIRCKHAFNCQETSNVFYGIAWMDVAWDVLSDDFQVALLDSLERTATEMTIQEVANTMYSLALMTYDSDIYTIRDDCGVPGGSSGNGGIDNSVDNPDSFPYILSRGGNLVNTDVVSLPSDTGSAAGTGASGSQKHEAGSFDALIMPLAGASVATAPTATSSRRSKSSSPNSDLPREDRLWRFHKAILTAFARIPATEYCKENYDQFGMYFELMRVVEGGNEMVYSILGRIPRTTGPCATIPSRLHSTTIHAMLARLNASKSYRGSGKGTAGGISTSTAGGNVSGAGAGEGRSHAVPLPYSVVNEFTGLHGVMPVDAAVYSGNTPVALVEIDGEFHYKSLGQQLRRKDRFKEFLYRVHYPDLPLFRIRSDQCKVVGTLRAGTELAEWISTIVEKKRREGGDTATAPAPARKKTAATAASVTKKSRASGAVPAKVRTTAKAKTAITEGEPGEGEVKRKRGRPKKKVE